MYSVKDSPGNLTPICHVAGWRPLVTLFRRPDLGAQITDQRNHCFVELFQCSIGQALANYSPPSVVFFFIFQCEDVGCFMDQCVVCSSFFDLSSVAIYS